VETFGTEKRGGYGEIMKLIKELLRIYKIPLLVSITLGVVIVALAVLKNPMDILAVFLASAIGTVFLDLDYFIYAYVTDVGKDFSKTLRGYIKYRDFSNAFSYIWYHREDIKEKTLESVLFQVVIGAFSVFMIFAPLNYFIKALILSIYVNSLYRLAERYFKGNIDGWFWVLKEKPSKKEVKIYLIASTLIFLVAIQFL